MLYEGEDTPPNSAGKAIAMAIQTIPNRAQRNLVRCRTLGFALMTVGIIAEILLVMAQLGGGQVQSTAFGVAALMIYQGRRLKKSAGK